MHADDGPALAEATCVRLGSLQAVSGYEADEHVLQRQGQGEPERDCQAAKSMIFSRASLCMPAQTWRQPKTLGKQIVGQAQPRRSQAIHSEP